jgi:hypothetical protein
MQRSIQRSTEGSSDFRNRSAPGPACLGPGKRGVTRATGQMAMQVAHRVQTSRFRLGQVVSCFIKVTISPQRRKGRRGTILCDLSASAVKHDFLCFQRLQSRHGTRADFDALPRLLLDQMVMAQHGAGNPDVFQDPLPSFVNRSKG